MYLDVVNPTPAVPAVRGLGAVRIRVPYMRSRGFGQVSQQLQSIFAGLQAGTLDAANYAGSGCGSGGNNAPCASAEDAANSIYPYAAMLCQENANAAQLTGGPSDPNCGDNGQALAASMYQQWLSLFQALPASTWTTEQAALTAGPGSYECAPGMTLITSGPSAGSCGLTSVVGGQSGSGTPTVIPLPNMNPAGSPAATLPNMNPAGSPAASSSPPPGPVVVTNPAPTPVTSPGAITGAVPDWLTGDIAGFPVWAWGLGAVALLFVFGGKK
jgi:hypothetical protein